MPEETKDLYDMTEEEFQQAFAKARDEQPRDEQGRFVAAEETEQVEQQEEQPTVFRREIDLKDGSGVQVFEADTPEGLIDKLVAAQENATRKIRELSAERKKEEPAPPKKRAELTEEEKWVLGQEIITDPDAAIDKVFERRTGRKLDKLAEDLAELSTFRQHQTEHQASVEFVSRHPEYEAVPQNADKLIKWMQLNGLPGTVENLERAYTDLNESGLLITKPAENEEKGESGDTAQERIAPTKVIIQKRSSSGLSAKRGNTTKPELTTEDLYNMPMDEFLKLGGMTKNGW